MNTDTEVCHRYQTCPMIAAVKHQRSPAGHVSYMNRGTDLIVLCAQCNTKGLGSSIHHSGCTYSFSPTASTKRMHDTNVLS